MCFGWVDGLLGGLVLYFFMACLVECAAYAFKLFINIIIFSVTSKMSQMHAVKFYISCGYVNGFH